MAPLPPPGFVPEEDLMEKPSAPEAETGGLMPPPGFEPESPSANEAAQPSASPQVEPTDKSFSDIFLEQGVLFGIGDEVAAAGSATGRWLADITQGKSTDWVKHFNQALDEHQAGTEVYHEENPALGMTAEIAGTMANPAAAAGSKWIAKGATLPRMAGRSALVGAGFGGVSGATHGEGGLADRGIEAAKSVPAGAVIGAAVPPIAAGLGKAVEVTARLIPGASKREAAMKIAEALWRDKITPDQAEIRLHQIGGDALLADVGDNMRRVAGSVMRRPGRVRTMGTHVLNQRQRHQHTRILEATKKAFGTKGGYYKQAADIMDARSSAATPLYEEAFLHPENQSIINKQIDRILETPAGKKALRMAVTKMKNDLTLPGKSDPEMTAALRELVQLGKAKPSPGGVGGLKIRTLDYVKRSLDDMIGTAKKAGRNDDARVLLGLKKTLVNEVDNADATGAYAQAREIWAGHAEALDAMEAGQKFMTGDAELTRQTFDKLSPADKAFFREGAFQKLSETVKGKREGVDKVALMLRTPGTREKLAVVVDKPQDFIGLMRRLLGEEKMHKTLRELGGSPTAERLEDALALGETGAKLRDLIWATKGNPFAQMRLFGHAAKGTKGPPRDFVAEQLAPLVSNERAAQLGLLHGARRMGPVAGANLGLPGLAAEGLAAQSYSPGLQDAEKVGLMLLMEAIQKGPEVVAQQ